MCVCVYVSLVFLPRLPEISVSMQGACVSVLCVLACVSVLLHSALSQPQTESDTYTVRMDESPSASCLPPPPPSHFLSVDITVCSCGLVALKFFEMKLWRSPFQHVVALIHRGCFSFNSVSSGLAFSFFFLFPRMISFFLNRSFFPFFFK